MPLKTCKVDGKSGWKYGDKGKCFVGPGAKRAAIKQGVATDGPQGFKDKMKAQGLAVAGEDVEGIADFLVPLAFERQDDIHRSLADSQWKWYVTAYISQEERDKVPDEDCAGPHKSFPIRNQEDVDHAATLTGHAQDPTAVKRKIIAIARRKGLKLPEAWSNEP